MYLTIVFLPLLGAFTAGIFGRYIGKQGAIIVTTLSVFLSSLLSFIAFYEVVLSHSVCSFKLFTWIESNSLIVSWGFLFDNLTVTMLIVVTFVSSLVHLYSSEYMSQDPHLARFMSYLSLFTFFMLMLVTADNYVQMFLGWEGVGLASYLLINFWYTRIQANKSAMKAMIVNKIGLSRNLTPKVYEQCDYNSIISYAAYYGDRMNAIIDAVETQDPPENYGEHYVKHY